MGVGMYPLLKGLSATSRWIWIAISKTIITHILFLYLLFPIVNFPFIDVGVLLAPKYGVYIYFFQSVCFDRVCSNLTDFNERYLF